MFCKEETKVSGKEIGAIEVVGTKGGKVERVGNGGGSEEDDSGEVVEEEE